MTRNIYIDVETGEEITKYKISKKEYRVFNKIKNIIQDDQRRIVEITNECRRNKWRQTNLFD